MSAALSEGGVVAHVEEEAQTAIPQVGRRRAILRHCTSEVDRSRYMQNETSAARVSLTVGEIPGEAPAGL
jgi:hypothetical protein